MVPLAEASRVGPVVGVMKVQDDRSEAWEPKLEQPSGRSGIEVDVHNGRRSGHRIAHPTQQPSWWCVL